MGKKLYLMLLMLFVPTMVLADSPHGDVTNNVTNVYQVSGSPSKDYLGTSLTLSAAQCQHDWGAKALQGCIGLADVEGKVGKTIGLGYRSGEILWNGTVSQEGELTGFAAGMNFHF